MIRHILAYEFHGLLYVIGASLLYIIVMPRFSFKGSFRKLLFLCILVVLTYCYFSFEDIDPLLYIVYLTPVGIALAVLFEGIIPGVATWAAFTFGGIFMVGNDWVTTLSGTCIILVIGLFVHYRGIFTDTLFRMTLLSLILVSLHLTAVYVVSTLRGNEPDTSFFLVAAVGTLLSSCFVSYMYYNVKNQERWQEEVFNAEKYHIIGQLAASISHEIRNPLTTSRGFLQLLGKDGLDKESFARYREFALQGIDNANAIITDYLNYAKPTVEGARPLDVVQEIDSIILWLQSLVVSSNIEIKINHMSSTPLIIRGESQKFQQCLLNLMKNAIEAMPDGGVLMICTKLENGKVSICIRDTGIGMSTSQVKRIGMPFYTTKEKGTGLGLMVVMSLIKAMNGTVVYRSKLGQGTTCEIQFSSQSAVTSEG